MSVPSLTAAELAALLDSLPVAVYRVDAAGRVTYANRGAVESVGRPLEAILGHTAEDFYPPELAARYREDDRRVLGGETLHQIEEHVEPATGRHLFVETTKHPIRAADGRIVGVQGMFLDVTERVQSEASLKDSRELLRLTFASLTDAVFVVDLDRREIVDCNDGAVRTFGWAREELIGSDTRKLHIDDERFCQFGAAYRTAYLTTGEMNGEIDMIRRDGTVFPVEYSGRAIPDFHGRRLFVGIMRDITERRRAEQERRRLEEQMQQAQKLESLGVLAGGVAHDFNNLLTAILGNIDLALLQLDAATPARAPLESARQASRRAADLCRQMLAYAGRGRLERHPVQLNDLVREMDPILRVSASKQVVFATELAAPLPPVEGDPSQLRQVVMNLVLNAAEAIGDQAGSVLVRTARRRLETAQLAATLLPDPLPAGDYVELTVRDTGCGMDAPTRARIFEPFFSTKFAGRGLGLATVLGIVRQHRGALQVESTPGAGTTFSLWLPASVSAAQTPGAAPATAAWRGRGLVLVVDDEDMVRATARGILAHLGFEVIEGRDGVDAVELHQRHRDRLRLVLLDLTMPRMNGTEALRTILRAQPGARVVLVSGYGDEDTAAGLLRDGATAFLAKPFEAAAFTATLRRVLGE
jgi:two-component system cell cycle sensor histidine kinase/response regulator CckA